MNFRFALPALLLGGLAFTSTAQADPAHDLDISGYHETFGDNFRGKLDVTAWGPSKWIAHTPWHGDFGDAVFADPRPGFPFMTGSQGLNIIATRGPDKKWYSGLLCSTDSDGAGFSQIGGYFEARMKLPPGPGTWPGFWLVAPGDATYKSEVDIIEYYGVAPEHYEIHVHLWPKDKNTKEGGSSANVKVPKDSLVNDWHTYGVAITDTEAVFYLDRHEVARLPAPPSVAQSPMSILINLALGSGWPTDKTPDPSVMEVDYVKAFAKN